MACGKEEKADYNIQVNAVKEAFEHKEMDSLRPFLASGYTIKGLPEGMESLILPQILKKMPAPDQFTIKSEIKEKRGTRINAVFYYKDGVSIPCNFLIAKDGKFLELNILDGAKITTEKNN